MQANTEEVKALEALGRMLEEAGWIPPAPLVETFDKSGSKELNRRLATAIAYLKTHEGRIRAAVCSGSAVRPEITAGGSVVSALADSLQALGGFVVPVWSVANALSHLGLTKFCARTSISEVINTDERQK